MPAGRAAAPVNVAKVPAAKTQPGRGRQTEPNDEEERLRELLKRREAAMAKMTRVEEARRVRLMGADQFRDETCKVNEISLIHAIETGHTALTDLLLASPAREAKDIAPEAASQCTRKRTGRKESRPIIEENLIVLSRPQMNWSCAVIGGAIGASAACVHAIIQHALAPLARAMRELYIPDRVDADAEPAIFRSNPTAIAAVACIGFGSPPGAHQRDMVTETALTSDTESPIEWRGYTAITPASQLVPFEEVVCGGAAPRGR
jgi:hypothetical protein